MSGGIAEPPQSLRPDRAADAPDRSVPDAVARHWADRRAPLALQTVSAPRAHRAGRSAPAPAPALLVVGGARRDRGREALAGPGFRCLLFWIGAVAMRGAGSTYNDIVDRDLDARVERTRWRPFPSGR